jgi:hypothetical protein
MTGGTVVGLRVHLPGDRSAAGEPIWSSGGLLAPDLSYPPIAERWPAAAIPVMSAPPADAPASPVQAGPEVRASAAPKRPVFEPGPRERVALRAQVWREAVAAIESAATVLAGAGQYERAATVGALGDLLTGPPVLEWIRANIGTAQGMEKYVQVQTSVPSREIRRSADSDGFDRAFPEADALLDVPECDQGEPDAGEHPPRLLLRRVGG